MEYDEEGRRIYGEFTDHLGQRVVVKKGAENSAASGAVQIRVGGKGLAIYAYPNRETVPVLMSALAAFMADTDGIPDLPEPDAGR